MSTTNLIPTGIEGLDRILFGGLRKGAVVLIEGLPGTGKTLLASELAHRSMQISEGNVLYISFENAEDFYLGSFANFGWDSQLRAAHQNNDVKFQFQHCVPQAFYEEFANGATTLRDRLRDGAFKKIVIDTLAPLRLLFEDKGDQAYRDFLRGLFDLFRNEAVTAFVVTETEPSRYLGETGAGPEHFLADTVITLKKEEARRSLLRTIEITKSRGQRVMVGRHSFKIDSHGISVYARAYARDRLAPAKPASNERVLFGIPGLEELLGGGVLKGSNSLIVGISGTGKTVAAMQFLLEGLKNGQSCLLTTLDDSPEQVCRNAQQLGFDFKPYIENGKLVVLHDSPLEIELDVHFTNIETIVQSKNVERAVIDSLATYESLLPKEARDFMLSLSKLLRNAGVTSLMAYECEELLGLSQISKRIKASSLADNIILLNYVEISTTLRRAITVPKARGSAPNHQTREYVIKSGGLAILDEQSVPDAEKVPQLPLSCYYGVLARSPTRHSPMIDESVAAGKPMPKSKIPKPVKAVKKPAVKEPDLPN